jgi:hypothetical protein
MLYLQKVRNAKLINIITLQINPPFICLFRLPDLDILNLYLG